jgi:hypothetical protein
MTLLEGTILGGADEYKDSKLRIKLFLWQFLTPYLGPNDGFLRGFRPNFSQTGALASYCGSDIRDL